MSGTLYTVSLNIHWCAMNDMLDGIRHEGEGEILRHHVPDRRLYGVGEEVARAWAQRPAAHAALKDLLDERIVERQIIGRQHIYRLNHAHRTVRDPRARVPQGSGADGRRGALPRRGAQGAWHPRGRGVADALRSVVRGPVREERLRRRGDRPGRAIEGAVERCLRDEIGPGFLAYFGMHLDPYVRTFGEFGKRMAKRLPPVSTMMDSYLVVHGRDPGGCGTG